MKGRALAVPVADPHRSTTTCVSCYLAYSPTPLVGPVRRHGRLYVDYRMPTAPDGATFTAAVRSLTFNFEKQILDVHLDGLLADVEPATRPISWYGVASPPSLTRSNYRFDFFFAPGVTRATSRFERSTQRFTAVS